MTMQLDVLINNIQAKIVMFRQMPIIVMLDKLSQQCGSPMMSGAMASPYVGTAVAGLCGKIATVDLKVDMLLGRAEFLLANALTAKEAMFARMNAAQAGGISGMAQGAMPPGGVVPLGMSGPKQFTGNGVPNDGAQDDSGAGG
jgi:hypothetical protein